MKRSLTILLVALLILGSVLGPRAARADAPAFQTFGDIWDYESPGYGCEDNRYIRLFLVDGVYYRADAPLTDEQFQQLMDIDIFDPDAEQKAKALLSALPIEHLYDLSAVMLSQAELDALIGKTGQELLDMGFVPQGSYGFSEEEQLSWASLDKGPFGYQVEFAEYVTVGDDPNVAEVIRPLTVKSAAWEGGVSEYAMAPDFDMDGGPSLADYEAMFAAPERVFYAIPEIPPADSPFQTLADVFAVLKKTNAEGGTPHGSYGVSESLFVAAFDANGTYYRVEAAIPADTAEKLDAIDFFDEQRDGKEEALLSPLPVTRVGDLSACRLSQAELDALVGKTGQELLDMGFEYGMGYSFWGSTQFYMNHGLFSYTVYMNEKVPEMEDYDAVLDELFRSLTVQKVEIDGIALIASDADLLW